MTLTVKLTHTGLLTEGREAGMSPGWSAWWGTSRGTIVVATVRLVVIVVLIGTVI